MPGFRAEHGPFVLFYYQNHPKPYGHKKINVTLIQGQKDFRTQPEGAKKSLDNSGRLK